MKTILVPTDFSPAAEWALEIGVDISRRSGAKLIVLHVIEQGGEQSFSVQGQIDLQERWEEKCFTRKLIETGNRLLGETMSKLEDMDLQATPELRFGNPYHGISAVISEYAADLIVMGTSEHSWIEKILVGSTTDKVVQHSRCPVITVHEKPTTSSFKNIVYATSLSENEDSFAGVLKVAQEIYGATIHVVRINTQSNFKGDSQVKQLMHEFVSRSNLKNVTLNIINDANEEEGILQFANSVGADLIALATRGRMSFVDLLSGSISDDIINHSKKPVLTYVTE